jgi:hypothetical protein
MSTAIDRVMTEWAKAHDIGYKSMAELRRLYYNRWVDHPRCCVEFRRLNEPKLHRHTFRTTEEAEAFLLKEGLQVLAEKVGDNYTHASLEVAARKVNCDYFAIQITEG